MTVEATSTDSHVLPAGEASRTSVRPARRVASPAERVARAALLLGAVAALFLSRVPLCPVAIGLHAPCPGCGLTRATLAMVRGDFSGAFHVHPLAFVVSPVLGIWIATTLHRYLTTGVAAPAPSIGRWANPALALTMFALFGLWMLRWWGYFGGPVAIAV